MANKTILMTKVRQILVYYQQVNETEGDLPTDQHITQYHQAVYPAVYP
jgi:hypothetical protein